MAERGAATQPGRLLSAHVASEPSIGGYERRNLIDASIAVLDGCYAHLRQKRTRYAIDPVSRLALLRPEVGAMTQRELDENLLGVYASLHDLHTGLRKSGRRGRATAVLPVLVERYGPPRRGRFLVTKLAAWADAGPLVEGSTLTHWNGIPIDVAVARHADRARGANPDARLARAMDTLTVRHLGDGMAPDEHWVDLRFLTPDREVAETRLCWRVLSLGAPEGRTAVEEVFDLALATRPRSDPRLQLAFDPAGQSAQQAKRALYAAEKPSDVPTSLPAVFRATQKSFGRRPFGHIRVWSFMHEDSAEFAAEFSRLARHFERERCVGLLVDIRANPGGYVASAESLLQALAAGPVAPARFAFAPTKVTRQLCANDPELGPWRSSIEAAVDTGEPYSQALPITDPSAAAVERATELPAVLIIDALAYSSADIFAAGWVDNGLGPIVGTASTTGAGGANVWTYEQITARLDQDDPALPPGLLGGTSLRVAVRRAVRSGASDGLPIEDIGVAVPPEDVHALTRRDLLDGNHDLLRFAAGRLTGGTTP
ncbi:MAG: S41 family peptidase [Acidimicrobiales bacterium]